MTLIQAAAILGVTAATLRQQIANGNQERSRNEGANEMTKQQNLTGQERCEKTTASGRRCVERKDHHGSHRVDLGFGKLVKVY